MNIYVCRLPEDLQIKIWREVFSDVIATISEKKTQISWEKDKAQNLKKLVKCDMGAYQPGYSDFDYNNNLNPFYCEICAHINFPCHICSKNFYNNKIEVGIFWYDFEPIYNDFNWEDPLNNEYIWDDN